MLLYTMPQFISEGVERTLQDPTEGSTVELVVRVEGDMLTPAEEWVVAHDGTVVDSLEHGLLEIELPEVQISALCDQGYVRSVERADEVIEVLDGGN